MNPYRYQFFDDANLLNYEAESKLKKVILLSAMLTIFIAGIGLLGLSMLTVESRYKEIGVRKVLGASVTSIVTLLSKDFLKLVIIAVVIASPLAWFVMNKWLQSFAYRTAISWKVFVITTVVALLIALITISAQAIKAAMANPVDSLRSE